MTRIKVALVGCGAVSMSHLAAWNRIPYAKVMAVCDRNEKAVDGVAEKWKIPHKFTSASDMIESEVTTLWDICTPIRTHKDLAKLAMEGGFDVLIEKPLTLSSEEAREIVVCQESTRRKAGTIHNWLFEPPVMKARELVKQGKIGEIVCAHIDMLHTRNDPMTRSKNHWSHMLPGGRISEMLIHPIYLLREFLGEVKLDGVEVAKIGDYPWMKQDELYATFRAGNKLAGTYVSFNAPRNSIFVNLFGRKGVLMVDVITTRVTFLPNFRITKLGKVLDSIRQVAQIAVSTASSALSVLSRRWFDGHEMCIRLFAESIVNDKEPPVTIKEGYETVKVLEELTRNIT